MYINDIQNCGNIISVILFEDDASIFHSDKCLKTLVDIIQQEINKISTWLYVNKLSINITKTKFILFKTKKKKLNYKIEISKNNQNIEQVNQTTFLGVIIDENLTWNSHLNLIYK